MTADLEETLRELGPGYREVVDRLVGAYAPAKVAPPVAESPRGRIFGWTIAYLAAASLVALLAIGVVFNHRDSAPAAPRSAPHEFRIAFERNSAAVDEIIRTQNPDGSWKTDFLTRQYASALSSCPGESAKIAYRKAIRNLRVRGLL